MSASPRRWTFLTNHGHTLVCIARDPDARLRDIAERVGITERAAQTIVADLVAEGYLVRHRVGRRNRYEVVHGRPMRHALVAGSAVGDVLDALDAVPAGGAKAQSAPSLRRPASA
ncbi:helix-turn-helix transcriptional regulator [Egicoccus sp. AB-alg2]|uniref:helix-turn-helix transcriptional regulator n=1 Tax=Egicoccus sp. AB-alg2 TaxID=3242693 RepID=UPI00359DEAF0